MEISGVMIPIYGRPKDQYPMISKSELMINKSEKLFAMSDTITQDIQVYMDC